MATIDQEIAKLLHQLPEAEQQRVLDFARELADIGSIPVAPIGDSVS